MSIRQCDTQLMFYGNAGDAIDLYQRVLGAQVLSMEKYGADSGELNGKVFRAVLSLAGQRIALIDSPVEHPFSFNPAISLFLELDDSDQLRSVFAGLEEGGSVMMPLGDYGFSPMFGWVADCFGVSWQLNLVAGSA